MRRREFITLLGGVMASWPLAVGAADEGLRQLDWIEGKTIVIEYRYAENRNDRLPELAAELVHLNVNGFVSAGHAGTSRCQAVQVSSR
jgi:putative tryptophan/tyrosine transport system substrate-binding protein